METAFLKRIDNMVLLADGTPYSLGKLIEWKLRRGIATSTGSFPPNASLLVREIN
jgi:hypothetical protein